MQMNGLMKMNGLYEYFTCLMHVIIFGIITIFVCRELMAAYPNAKVLLTVRDPVKWFHSVKSTIFKSSLTFFKFPNVVLPYLTGRLKTLEVIEKMSWTPMRPMNKSRLCTHKPSNYDIFAWHISYIAYKYCCIYKNIFR